VPPRPLRFPVLPEIPPGNLPARPICCTAQTKYRDRKTPSQGFFGALQQDLPAFLNHRQISGL
jgi:hypothetical protein